MPRIAPMDRECVAGSRRWDDRARPFLTLDDFVSFRFSPLKFQVYLCLARFSSVIFGDVGFNPEKEPFSVRFREL